MGLLSQFFVRRPLLANTVSSGALLAAGDAIQQCIEFRRGVHKETRYNWRRTGRMLVVGLVEGPPHHWWYTGLDRLLPGRTARVVRLKILADQLVAAPLFAVTFFVGMDLLEGRTLRDGLQEFKRKFPEVYLFDWCIWPPTQWLNFTYVPERYRVLYVNVVTVVWDVFLSYSKHRDQLEPEGEDTVARSPLHHRPAAQLKVSAFDPGQPDPSDLQPPTSGQTDVTDCIPVTSDPAAGSGRDCGLPADWPRTAGGAGTRVEDSEGSHRDGEGVGGRSVSAEVERMGLCRRRAAS